SKAVGERLAAVAVAVDLGHVIGHQHSVVTNLFVRADCTSEVHIAIVREGLLKLQKSAFDIAKMNVENLSSRSKIADGFVNFCARVLQTLSNRALAEI